MYWMRGQIRFTHTIGERGEGEGGKGGDVTVVPNRKLKLAILLHVADIRQKELLVAGALAGQLATRTTYGDNMVPLC